MAWPRACASSNSANVESPRMLIRSIGSICTATVRPIPNLLEISLRNQARKRVVNILWPIWRDGPARGFRMVNLPRFSIATKLYAIFALLATVTVALAFVAVVNANRHVATAAEYEA